MKRKNNKKKFLHNPPNIGNNNAGASDNQSKAIKFEKIS